MTKKKPTLAERLAPMSISEIDAMTDDEAAQLVGATPEQISQAKADGREWSWKAAARAATDEAHNQHQADIATGRARVITDPDELERYRQMGRDEIARRRGRPSLGVGDSMQLRVRVNAEQLAAIDRIAADRHQSRSEFLRDAIDEHIASHVS